MISRGAARSGFALPTIVISTVILFMVLVAAMSSVTSTNLALDEQYYQQLAKDAAESGITQATECLQINGYVSTWNGTYLRPHSRFAGAPLCIDQASCFTIYTPTYRARYYVGDVTNNGDGTMTLSSTGVVTLIRTSTGAIWKTINYQSKAVVGGQIKSQVTTFGYNSLGAFYGTLGGDGRLRVAGYNGQGQLGTGNTTNQVVPVVYTIPSTSPIVNVYSNASSSGHTLFALTAAGEVYGTGMNSSGQLGNGTVSATQTTPVKYNLPAGKNARSVVAANMATYVITTDGNVYAAGQCASGMLGSNYTIAGCSNQSTPVRVNLPTPNVADPNTLPTDDLASDYLGVFLRMQGGRVYGWGINEYGQFGNGTRTASSTPVQIGLYGNAGQPTATDVAYDGNTAYILDSNGAVYSAGRNNFGQSGIDKMSLYLPSLDKCLGNNNSDNVTITFAACNGSTRQLWSANNNNALLYMMADTTRCLENTSGDGYSLALNACNAIDAQRFDPTYPHFFRNRLNGKYIDNEAGNGVTAKLYAPSGTGNQIIHGSNAALVRFSGYADTFNDKVIKMSTDQWNVSVLTERGEVWSAGANTSGMFGDGTQAGYNPYLRKFALPAGVHAVDLYNTYTGDPSTTQWHNLFVIGDDGKVYGAGSNVFGQLGNGATAATVSTPVVMNTIGTVNGRAVSVQAGLGTTIVRTSSGATYTVGNNSVGQLGDGTTTNSSVPILGKFLNGQAATTY